jgi:hypothetical protein
VDEWKGQVDAETLLRNIMANRLISTRPESWPCPCTPSLIRIGQSISSKDHAGFIRRFHELQQQAGIAVSIISLAAHYKGTYLRNPPHRTSPQPYVIDHSHGS